MSTTLFWAPTGARLVRLLCLAAPALAFTPAALASDAAPAGIDEAWNLYGQATHVTQGHPGFHAPYSGTNSLSPNSTSAETADLTLFAGWRLGANTALYLNPEMDQGFGLNNTVGVAGFTSGAAYKVGNNAPYFRMPRAFVRHVINLGGETVQLESAPNQLAGTQSADNLTLTVGKFSVVDLFDTNRYAHDPRGDFLNWSILEGGAFDYAADAWGYTYGAAAEWTQDWWTLRGGVFDLSKVPNSTQLETGFNQYELVSEFEARHQWNGHPGKVKVLAFVNRGNMGSYSDAVQLAQQTGGVPDTSQVRRRASRSGALLNLEQELSPDLGVFARASVNSGNQETFEFTDINRSLSSGLSLSGDCWGRAQDKLGVAFVVNGLSGQAKQYFAAGGMGVLVGDGQMRYGNEKVAEVFYNWQAMKHLSVGFDLQYVVNPAYNRDRGPIPVYALRLHADF